MRYCRFRSFAQRFNYHLLLQWAMLAFTYIINVPLHSCPGILLGLYDAVAYGAQIFLTGNIVLFSFIVGKSPLF